LFIIQWDVHLKFDYKLKKATFIAYTRWLIEEKKKAKQDRQISGTQRTNN